MGYDRCLHWCSPGSPDYSSSQKHAVAADSTPGLEESVVPSMAASSAEPATAELRLSSTEQTESMPSMTASMSLASS